jgi:predicted RNase H-related nuclease YkuK (DUF458 family)
MFNENEILEIRDFIQNTSKESKIYIGTDSQVKSRGKTRYASVIVIHYDGQRGAKIFGTTSIEKDIKEKKSRPFNRMMNETMKTCEVYKQIEDIVGKRYLEVHLDVNPDEKHGSNVAISAAVGYVQGVLGVVPVVTKPASASFAASCAADKWVKS